jgi:hypothetical protein
MHYLKIVANATILETWQDGNYDGMAEIMMV